MSISNATKERYDGGSIFLHWVMAIGIVGNFCVGLYMANLPMSMARLKLFNYHKWAGATILLVAALRLLWRLTHRPPKDLPMPGWQQAIATATHWSFYALFFALPLVGWAYSSAAGFPIVVFGILPLPDLVPQDRALAEALRPWHRDLAWVMFVLVGLHVAGVAKHLMIDGDGLLRRMLPSRR